MKPRTLLNVISRRALLAFVAAATLASLQGVPKATPPPSATRVLFLGNSYTYVNDLPALVRAFGRAAKPPRAIEFECIAPGGCTLEMHAAEEGVRSPRARIADGKFDFVVLQEQSRRPLVDADAMLAAARALGTAIDAAKATPVWFATWAREKQLEEQDAITKSYEQCAVAVGGRVAPVGAAWKDVLTSKEKLRLHDEDGSHPNAAGSYLAALVIYATITGDDVDVLPAKLVETNEHGEERVLLDVPTKDAKLLRKAAAKALAAQRAVKR